jgi:predicted nucleotidyltransferase
MDFSVEDLGAAIERACPEVLFAYLMGSAANGHVAVGSDLDVALYVRDRLSWKTLRTVQEIVDGMLPGVHCDAGALNQAEPIYRFEALKGRRLFVRAPEDFLRFYSLTCREYEDQMADYERQLRYRVENGNTEHAA